ncbi:MAG: M6 family metalloprotease domain-containing protein [Candidatus Hermodarchaeota archaeon]
MNFKFNRKILFILLFFFLLNSFFFVTNDNNIKISFQHKSEIDNYTPRIADESDIFSSLSHELPHFSNANFSMLHQIENDTILAHNSPFTQTITVTIFCVDFPNKAHTLTGQEVEERFNSATLNDLRDYWSELSKDHLILNFDIHDWYTAPNNVEYYATEGYYQGYYIPDRRLLDLVEEVYDYYDDTVDFSNYIFQDLAGNTRSYIGFILPGWCESFGQIYSGDTSDREFWSCKWANYIDLDGITVNNFFITSEFPNSPGIATHEFGHMLGLPDLYDLTGVGTGVGEWCLMGYGGGLGYINNDIDTFGTTPGHLCAWSKIKFGWADTQTLRVAIEAEQVEIDAFNPNEPYFPRIYKILRYTNEIEYFLLEARFQTIQSFDYYIADEGLLILHVDEDNQQTLEGGYMVDVEENEETQELEDQTLENYGDEDDCWDEGDIFSSTSNPNSNWYGGTDSKVTIEVISIDPDERIIVRITAPKPPEPPIVNSFPIVILLTISFAAITVVLKNTNVKSKKKSHSKKC